MKKSDFERYIKKIVREEINREMEDIVSEIVTPILHKMLKEIALSEKIEIKIAGKHVVESKEAPVAKINTPVRKPLNKLDTGRLIEMFGGPAASPQPETSKVNVLKEAFGGGDDVALVEEAPMDQILRLTKDSGRVMKIFKGEQV